MNPINDSWLVQIEVTNVCTHKCANCTRFVGHHQKPYFMPIEDVEKAIDSLEGFPNNVGIMGGEPTLHPKFLEICEILRSKVPSYKCGLWTSGYKWDEYKKEITRTFGEGVYYNDHSDPRQKHQPMLVAIQEVIKDKDLMWELINKCKFQEEWSASINPKGGFFCEVAAALDIVFDGPGGYPIEKGWWDKTPEDYRDQIERYCVLCGGGIPCMRPSNKEQKDLITPGNLKKLQEMNSPKVRKGNYELFEGTMDEEVRKHQDDWNPLNYLGSEFSRKKNLKLDELWLLIGFHGIRRRFNKWKWKLTHRKKD